MKYESFSPEQTIAIGEALGKNAEKGRVYCLIGDLGVGKTLFTKGFAKGLGIKEHITSPTFTIINEYECEGFIFSHFDVYRINYLEEMYELGYEDYFYGEGIAFVEWANLIKTLIPEDAIWIEISKMMEKGTDYRIIEISE